MTIINNNVQNVKFLRNQTPFESREAARTALENNKGQAADGTALLARYTITDGQTTDVKTLVGFVAEVNSTKYVTIFDVEGGSEDVEKLRQEINAKLGTTFISSGNTVEANLTALSGDTFVPGTSSSANTSVEGAKAYAYDLLGTLDYTDTAATGSYVSEVNQVDGKISVTRVELPSSADTAEAKKVVIAVSEDKGQIEVTRGEISSSAKTIVLNDNEDGGIDFDVNIDGTSIVKDANGVLSVASTALTQYSGDTITIAVSPADANNNKTISSLLTITKVTTGLDADVKEEYRLVGSDDSQIGQAIKIYKDSSLLSVALLHADTAANPQVLPTYDKATDTWTDISTPTEANQALCFAYENVSGNTVIAAVPVGSFINEQEFASGVTWDSANGKVKGVVDPTSEKDSQDTPVDFLTVGANGFKINGIKDEIDKKLNAIVEGLDATVTDATSGNHVTITIEELDGKLVQSGLTIEENDIASASDLAGLSAKTITDINSANGSITVTPANADDGTQEIDLATDASKIKMTGFTTENTKSLSAITESSSVTESFEEVQDVIDGVNDRIDDLENNFVSGVTVNGTSVVTDHVGAISISGGTAAASSANAVVVNTDSSTGAITISLGTIDCGTY